MYTGVCSYEYHHLCIADGEVLFRIKINTSFPVDLYALMDLSGSMDIHRQNLIKAAEEVAKTIKKDTKDFRFGFGGFRDKPRSPFGGGKCQILLVKEIHIRFYPIRG